MSDMKKKIMIGAGAAAAFFAAGAILDSVVTKKMVDAAMNRESPVNLLHLKKKPVNTEEQQRIMDICANARERLLSEPTEMVEITAADGEKLAGYWYPAENPKRAVVAVHGWRSSWLKDFSVVSEFWHNEGCSVLFAQQRGQNESGGDYMGFGLTERYDVLDWAKYLEEKTEGKLPIYLSGLSMGAASVLMASEFDLPENVCGITADCGFTSPAAICRHMLEDNFHLPYGIHRKTVDKIFRERLKAGLEDASTVDSLKKCKVPVFFIHGTEDKTVPVEMTYENYRACAAPKRMLIVPGAGHATSYIYEKEKYEAEIKSFWADCEDRLRRKKEE